MAHRSDGDASAETTRSIPVYARLALGMAVFGSATPVSKIVTGVMPVFVGSLLRVALGALVLAPFVAGRWHQVRQLGAATGCRNLQSARDDSHLQAAGTHVPRARAPAGESDHVLEATGCRMAALTRLTRGTPEARGGYWAVRRLPQS
jgi:hypothetical protein